VTGKALIFAVSDWKFKNLMLKMISEIDRSSIFERKVFG